MLISENQSGKLRYSLEDSLSDLYAYIQCELENAIKNRQDFVDKKIVKLKMDLSIMKKPAN